MAAFVGWLVAVSGVHFPGLVSFSEGVSFEDLSKLPPMQQWEALPAGGKQQILFAIGCIEHQSEWKLKPHYMAVGRRPRRPRVLAAHLACALHRGCCELLAFAWRFSFALRSVRSLGV